MAYRCRAYPDEAQQQMLSRTFGCVRLVWNRTLAERHARYQAEGKSISYAESDRALTVMKHDRDVNAAKNILAAGLAAGAGNGADACGGGARRAGATRARSPVKLEPLGVSPGIPVL
jgi:transposase